MNVNITLVTTSTWPAVGPRRFGLGPLRVPSETGSESEGLAESLADIRRRFRRRAIEQERLSG
jgi:hypothetical protein